MADVNQTVGATLPGKTDQPIDNSRVKVETGNIEVLTIQLLAQINRNIIELTNVIKDSIKE